MAKTHQGIFQITNQRTILMMETKQVTKSTLTRVLPSLAKLHQDNLYEATKKFKEYLDSGKCNYEFVLVNDTLSNALVKNSLFKNFTIDKTENQLKDLLIDLTHRLASKIINNQYPLNMSSSDIIEKRVEQEVFNQLKKLVVAHLGRNVLAAILVGAAVGALGE